MSLASDLLTAAFQIGEGTRKDGFNVGGVTYQYNQDNDTISGTFTIPVTPSIDVATGIISYQAKDAFNPPA